MGKGGIDMNTVTSNFDLRLLVKADKPDPDTSSTSDYAFDSVDTPIIFEQPEITVNQQKVNGDESSTGHDDMTELDPEEEASFYRAVRR